MEKVRQKIKERSAPRRRKKEQAEREARGHARHADPREDHREKQGQIAHEKDVRAKRQVGREHLMDGHPAQRDGQQREGQLHEEQQGDAEQPAAGFAEQNGQRPEVGHAQEPERAFLLFLGNRASEITQAGEGDEEKIGEDDRAEKREARRAHVAVRVLRGQEHQQDEADKAAAREVGLLEAVVFAQGAREKRERRGVGQEHGERAAGCGLRVDRRKERAILPGPRARSGP